MLEISAHNQANAVLQLTVKRGIDPTGDTREFLRYKRVTADGKLLEVNPRDLYDLTQHDKRTDRILPNSQ